MSSGRSAILGSPKSTTSKTVYVGMDGELLSGSLAPFLRYAIAAGGNIDFDASVKIAREDNAPENSSVFTNGSLNVKTFTSSVEGFGFHHGGVDEEEALVTFSPRYNPLSLGVEQEVATKMVIPEFIAEDYQSLATRSDGNDVQLAGHYNLGTQDAPAIWYVDGKVKTSGTVTFSGYGVIVANDNIEFKHAVRNIDSGGAIGLYSSKDIKIDKLAPVSLVGQIYSDKFESKSDIVLYGSITAFGDVKFTNDISVDLKHRPAEKVLVEPFWPSN
ncbi:MAG: hypothetical protein HKN13_08040 [Rhodothermales bacterium]|nr:hypothetical protein [Rhodothermales bacterium]